MDRESGMDLPQFDIPELPEANIEELEPEELPEAHAETKETPTSRYEQVANGIREFWATQIKGEVREKSHEDEMAEEFDPLDKKIIKAAVPAVAGAMASIFGVKSFVDVPRYLSQKYFTEQEKSGLLEVYQAAESGREARRERAPEAPEDRDAGELAREVVGGKAAELTKAINESKYLTAEKKHQLLERISQINETHREKIDGAGEDRTKAFAEALNATIETRVKGTVALKEALNTVAVASGLSVARALVFGGVSAYERYARVTKEMESGKREGSLFQEVVVNGAKETLLAATFQEGETTGARIKNAAESWASIMRFAGMAAVGMNELNQEGVSEAISKAIGVLESKSLEKTVGFVGENFAENAHHVASFFGLAGEHAGAGAEGVGELGAAAGEHGATAAENASEAIGHGVGAGFLSHEAMTTVQEALHIGETKAEIGLEIHEEALGEEEEHAHDAVKQHRKQLASDLTTALA